MWSTIENFRESLSQIASDVLDTAEELETGGSEHIASDASNSCSHRRRHHSHQRHHASNSSLDTELWDGTALHPNGKENDIKSPGDMLNGFASKVKELQVQNRKFEAREKDLLTRISGNNVAYASLKDAHTKALAEISNLKEMLEKERADLATAKLQIQRDHKMVEEVNRESKRLKSEKQKMSMEITELQGRLSGQMAEKNSVSDAVRAQVLKEAESKLLLKDERIEQLQSVVKNLENKNSHIQAEIKKLKESSALDQQLPSDEERHAYGQHDGQLVERKGSAQQAVNGANDADMARIEYEKKFDAICAERDKALRDLNRLKQHLLAREQMESEKMDQDSKHIVELKEKADASAVRAMHLEQSLAQTLSQQAELNKKNVEQLDQAIQEVENLKRKLAACSYALESKDTELLNLQAALGQYYAESEAKDRLHAELSAARKELTLLSDNLKAANNMIELKDRENNELVEKLAEQRKKVLESQEKTHKFEADILMLRRALEQSLTRLNRMSSDSDYYVDRRIVIKLLVTYFQRQQSKEVLDLMSRMLGFSEEDKQMISIAQQGGGKGVVRGVLGLPGRVVGGLLKSGSSSSVASPSQSENQSFADLWIDFLLKETEERERREAVATEAGASGEGHSAPSHNTNHIQGSTNISYSGSNDTAYRPKSTPELVPVNGPPAMLDQANSASEFSTVPLNSVSTAPIARGFLHTRTSNT